MLCRACVRVLASIFLMSLIALSSAAQDIQTVQFDLPSQPLQIFGMQFMSDHLAPPTGTIVETRAELHFTTDSSFDAADISLMLQAPSVGVPMWRFTGADLGWAGAGTFDASLTTDELNGLIDLGTPPPQYSLFLVEIHAVNYQPLGGQFTSSYFQVDIMDDDPTAIPGDPLDSPPVSNLTHPFPNPTASELFYTITLAREEHVTVRIFDIGGHLLSTLVEKDLPSGRFPLSWDGEIAGSRVAAGIYFMRLETDTRRVSRKITIR